VLSVTLTPGGPHRDGAAEATARAEHREGWEFFLPRLGSLVSG
jgi:hypothetical protein